MKAHSIRRRAIIFSLGVYLFICTFQSGAMSEDHTQGFPPLARVRLAVSEAQVPLLMEALQQFAETESLTTAKGEFQKEGRSVRQLTLKVDDGTFYFMSNFKNKEHYELTAYSHATPSTWKPIWLRLVNRLVQALGRESVQADIDVDPLVSRQIN